MYLSAKMRYVLKIPHGSVTSRWSWHCLPPLVNGGHQDFQDWIPTSHRQFCLRLPLLCYEIRVKIEHPDCCPMVLALPPLAKNEDRNSRCKPSTLGMLPINCQTDDCQRRQELADGHTNVQFRQAVKAWTRARSLGCSSLNAVTDIRPPLLPRSHG